MKSEAWIRQRRNTRIERFNSMLLQMPNLTFTMRDFEYFLIKELDEILDEDTFGRTFHKSSKEVLRDE